MLREEDRKEIQERLNQLTEPVNLILFTQKLAGTCQYCSETEQLLKELLELSDKLNLEVKNFVTDTADVEKYGIDKIPATVIMGKEDVGIRFFGIPAGYEFAALLEIMLVLSSGETGLSEQMKTSLKKIDKPVHIQVFVTPTCPHCTTAVLTAERFSVENPNIRVDVVEVSEFPQLGQKYGVMGVPKVVINESHSFEGALPEDTFYDHVANAVKNAAKEKTAG